MFARLTGTIDTIGAHTAIIDVHGVGYLVTCSARTLARLGDVGSAVRLRIETQVREDAINLFGFMDSEEQEWFRLLTTVQGVGAKVAMAILGACAPSQLQMAIAAQDKTMLTQADGVGPKLATRIVTELKDKVPELLARLDGSGLQVVGSGGAKGRRSTPEQDAGAQVDGDVLSALENLGYARAEGFAALMSAKSGLETLGKKTDNVADLIRLCLSELGQAKR